MDIRERIITAAFELFANYGIRSVTMDQIAGQLGISKRTLYEAFENKNELLKAGLEYFIHIKNKEANEIIKESDNVIQAIYILRKKGEELKKKINPLFFEDIKKCYPDIYSLITSRNNNRDFSVTHALFKKGINDGIFKKDLNIELVNIFFHEIMHIAMNDKIFPGEEYSQEDMLKNILMPYLSGISTDKGNELIKKYFEKEIK
jgi:AcrR family transcriptional regulator